MPSYLERYLNGEQEQVWNELIALGDRVRQEPIYSDARAVAAETMQRVRRNIEKLYQRLQSIGYQFDCERARSSNNPLEGLRNQLSGDSLTQGILGNMLKGLESFQNQFMQTLGGRDAKGSPRPTPPPPRAYNPPEADIKERLDEFEQEIGLLPISVRAWCEIVGDVNFIGDHPGLATYARQEAGTFDFRSMVRQIMVQNPHVMTHMEETDDEALKDYLEQSPDNSPFPASAMMGMRKLMREEMDAAKAEAESKKSQPRDICSDPLAFAFEIDAEQAREEMEDQALEDEEATGAYSLIAAPDIYHKANISGSTYDIVVPEPGADGFLHGTDMHFVAYLRNSFAWGGFPALEGYDERDYALIAFLKEGLEPI